MFKHILAPVDGSATSMAALDKAAELAKACGAAITVVYVVDPYPFTGVGSEFAYGQDQYLTAARGEARAAMDGAAQRLQDLGVEAETRVLESHAVWRGIVEAVDAVGADLVVIGSHGRRGLERLVLGSVTQSVLAHTSISTLVVRMQQAAKASV